MYMGLQLRRKVRARGRLGVHQSLAVEAPGSVRQPRARMGNWKRAQDRALRNTKLIPGQQGEEESQKRSKESPLLEN